LKKLTPIHFFLILTVIGTQCQSPKDSALPIRPKIDVDHPKYYLADSLLTILKSEVDSLHCPGFAITILADSSILKMEGYGYANLSLRTRIDENTNFRIASLSKSFAALTAKILEKEGKLSFDDKVIKYIPDLKFKDPNLTNNLTIGHLLSMSTGLTTHSYTNLVENNLSLDEIIPSFSSEKPIYPLGQYATYQNAAFGLIEKVIYNITNQTYENHLKEKVLLPLNMKSSFTCDDFINNKNHAWPHNYNEADSSYFNDGFNQKYYNLVSAGGINASISDLSKYVQFLINGDSSIIPTQKLQELFVGQVAVLPERRSYEKWQYVDTVNYAFGWRTLRLTNGSEWVFHGGYVNRYQSLIAFNPKEKVGLAVLFNNDCGVGSDVMKWFVQIFEGLPEVNDQLNPISFSDSKKVQ
jgi:beta-lactamase class C